MTDKLIREIAIGLHTSAEPKPRSDLTPEQKAEALRIGRIEFKSAGARRRFNLDRRY